MSSASPPSKPSTSDVALEETSPVFNRCSDYVDALRSANAFDIAHWTVWPLGGLSSSEQPRPLPATQHEAFAGLPSGPIAFCVCVHQYAVASQVPACCFSPESGVVRTYMPL